MKSQSLLLLLLLLLLTCVASSAAVTEQTDGTAISIPGARSLRGTTGTISERRRAFLGWGALFGLFYADCELEQQEMTGAINPVRDSARDLQRRMKRTECRCIEKTCTPSRGKNTGKRTFYPADGSLDNSGHKWCFVDPSCYVGNQIGNGHSCDGAKFAFVDGWKPSWSKVDRPVHAIPSNARRYADGNAKRQWYAREHQRLSQRARSAKNPTTPYECALTHDFDEVYNETTEILALVYDKLKCPLVKEATHIIIGKGGGRVKAEACAEFDAEAVATCEAVGGGPEDPLADACTVVLTAAFTAVCKKAVDEAGDALGDLVIREAGCA